MGPRAPPNDTESLETEIPCLIIRQVDSEKSISRILAIRDRAYDTVAGYRADSYDKGHTPKNAEIKVETLLNKYQRIFSSRLTVRPSLQNKPDFHTWQGGCQARSKLG